MRLAGGSQAKSAMLMETGHFYLVRAGQTFASWILLPSRPRDTGGRLLTRITVWFVCFPPFAWLGVPEVPGILDLAPPR
jgi:hypothetical protein